MSEKPGKAIERRAESVVDATSSAGAIVRRRATELAPIPKWRARTAITPPSLTRSTTLGRWAYEMALAPDDAFALGRFADIAAELKPLKNGTSTPLAIGVTASGRRNRQGMTAVGLATTWARWNYHTLIVEIGGRKSDLGRPIGRTTPTIADLIRAIEDGRPLPAPTVLTTVLERLEAISDLDGYAIAQLADSGRLDELNAALRERYQRIVWSLPHLNDSMSVSSLAKVIDRFVVSARRGQADRRPIERFGRQIDEADLTPLHLVWHG
ncbi:MAG: hypothetical protein ACF8PN_13075 [Phycisphaerales bacterium]